MTDRAQASSGAAKSGGGRSRRGAARGRVHGGQHPGPRGARGGAAPARHVHRLDRRARAPSPRLGGRRQLDRRGDGRPCHADRGADPPRRDGRRDRRRTRRPGRAGTRPARTRSRSSTPSSTPAGKFGGGGYKVSGGLHGVGVSVVNALSEWLRVETARDGHVWAQEYVRGKPSTPVTKVGPQGARKGTRTAFRADPEVFDASRLRLRDDRPAPPRVGLPQQGALDHAPRRARRPRALVLLRGRARLVRAAPQPPQGGAPRAADRGGAARRRHDDRGRPPVQRLVHGERLRLRQQHQHGGRRDPHHGVPGRPHELAQRLGPARRDPQGQRRQPLRRRRPRGPHRGGLA